MGQLGRTNAPHSNLKAIVLFLICQRTLWSLNSKGIDALEKDSIIGTAQIVAPEGVNPERLKLQSLFKTVHGIKSTKTFKASKLAEHHLECIELYLIEDEPDCHAIMASWHTRLASKLTSGLCVAD